MRTDLIRKTARAIHGSHKVAVFTRAGISVESGIPDFREAGATIVEVNLEETPLTRDTSDWILKGPASVILQSVWRKSKVLRGRQGKNHLSFYSWEHYNRKKR